MLKADRTEVIKSKGRRNYGDRVISKRHAAVEVTDYRYKNQTRKNIPDAGLASYNHKPQGRVKYNYDPHLDPQLVWAGKAERSLFDAETVSLHIHERVSAQAILKSVQRAEKTRQLRLFAEPELPLDKRIEFYQHEMDWANRLILGDSLLVMNSLLERELMAGKVQMIYVDPPYGIAYSSNFQPYVTSRDVKDGRDNSLTREPEQIKAYRDTWRLGIHSYLTYLRDRLLLAHKLLHESGSIFVQINDENIHLVRAVMDEVFGRGNFVSMIAFVRAGAQTARTLPSITDYLLWYAKDKLQVKFRRLLVPGGWAARAQDQWAEYADGKRERLAEARKIVKGARLFTHRKLESATGSEASRFPIQFQGKTFLPTRGWSTTKEGIERLKMADRLLVIGNSLRYVVYLDDFEYSLLTNNWTDTFVSGFASERLFVVQTFTKVVERCILMTTDPGDLVFDPTCGSGTTAYCAEKFGRLWITCDTSRVAIAITRQRLMTARFEYLELADSKRGPSLGFIYQSAPRVTLASIVHNTEIDIITAKYQRLIDVALRELNQALGKNWQEWEVPHEAESGWPPKAKNANERFWALKIGKRQDVDESIKRNAQQEALYDCPRVGRGVVRVSGPFTVEAIPVLATEEEALEESGRTSTSIGEATDYVNSMIELLRKDGVTFPGRKKMALENLRQISSAGFLHAQGEASQNGGKVRVAVSFGPRHGPITAKQVDESIRSSYRLGFDILVLAGFAFDPEAQAMIQKNPIPKLKVHLANISPDVIVGDLLKTTRGSQLFTAFGQPDIRLEKHAGGFVVKMLGVDIYDPETGEVHSSSADEVPAWFLDEDYDGYTFRICQAFFPKEATAKNPWDKLENALRGIVDKKKMEMFRGTISLPFKAGQERRMAVKVIDNRGNEVIVVKPLVNGEG